MFMTSRAAETKESVVEEFRRDTILRAARHVIARRGLAGASMQAIADEAGVAKGTLYLYFHDRDDAARAGAAAVPSTSCSSACARCWPRSSRSARACASWSGRSSSSSTRTTSSCASTWPTRAPDEAACHRRRRRPQYARYLELLTGHLAAAVRRGEMKPFDPARVALFFVEGRERDPQRRLEERNRPTAEDVEWIVELLLNGLAARKRA